MPEKRTAKESDVTFNLEGVGDFRLAQMTVRDVLNVSIERARLSSGMGDDQEVGLLASAIARITVPLVNGPDGWCTADELQDLDRENIGKIIKLYFLIVDQEDSFRVGVDTPNEEDSEKTL
jgi:hypothetical protein